MQKVKIISTGEIREVTNNEAHGLIESGVGKLYKGYEHKMESAQADESLSVDDLRGVGRFHRRRGYRIK